MKRISLLLIVTMLTSSMPVSVQAGQKIKVDDKDLKVVDIGLDQEATAQLELAVDGCGKKMQGCVDAQQESSDNFLYSSIERLHPDARTMIADNCQAKSTNALSTVMCWQHQIHDLRASVMKLGNTQGAASGVHASVKKLVDTVCKANYASDKSKCYGKATIQLINELTAANADMTEAFKHKAFAATLLYACKHGTPTEIDQYNANPKKHPIPTRACEAKVADTAEAANKLKSTGYKQIISDKLIDIKKTRIEIPSSMAQIQKPESVTPASDDAKKGGSKVANGNSTDSQTSGPNTAGTATDTKPGSQEKKSGSANGDQGKTGSTLNASNPKNDTGSTTGNAMGKDQPKLGSDAKTALNGSDKGSEKDKDGSGKGKQEGGKGWLAKLGFGTNTTGRTGQLGGTGKGGSGGGDGSYGSKKKEEDPLFGVCPEFMTPYTCVPGKIGAIQGDIAKKSDQTEALDEIYQVVKPSVVNMILDYQADLAIAGSIQKLAMLSPDEKTYNEGVDAIGKAMSCLKEPLKGREAAHEVSKIINSLPGMDRLPDRAKAHEAHKQNTVLAAQCASSIAAKMAGIEKEFGGDIKKTTEAIIKEHDIEAGGKAMWLLDLAVFETPFIKQALKEGHPRAVMVDATKRNCDFFKIKTQPWDMIPAETVLKNLDIKLDNPALMAKIQKEGMPRSLYCQTLNEQFTHYAHEAEELESNYSLIGDAAETKTGIFGGSSGPGYAKIVKAMGGKTSSVADNYSLTNGSGNCLKDMVDKKVDVTQNDMKVVDELAKNAQGVKDLLKDIGRIGADCCADRNACATTLMQNQAFMQAYLSCQNPQLSMISAMSDNWETAVAASQTAVLPADNCSERRNASWATCRLYDDLVGTYKRNEALRGLAGETANAIFAVGMLGGVGGLGKLGQSMLGKIGTGAANGVFRVVRGGALKGVTAAGLKQGAKTVAKATAGAVAQSAVMGGAIAGGLHIITSSKGEKLSAQWKMLDCRMGKGSAEECQSAREQLAMMDKTHPLLDTAAGKWLASKGVGDTAVAFYEGAKVGAAFGLLHPIESIGHINDVKLMNAYKKTIFSDAHAAKEVGNLYKLSPNSPEFAAKKSKVAEDYRHYLEQKIGEKLPNISQDHLVGLARVDYEASMKPEFKADLKKAVEACAGKPAACLQGKMAVAIAKHIPEASAGDHKLAFSVLDGMAAKDPKFAADLKSAGHESYVAKLEPGTQAHADAQVADLIKAWYRVNREGKQPSPALEARLQLSLNEVVKEKFGIKNPTELSLNEKMEMVSGRVHSQAGDISLTLPKTNGFDAKTGTFKLEHVDAATGKSTKANFTVADLINKTINEKEQLGAGFFSTQATEVAGFEAALKKAVNGQLEIEVGTEAAKGMIQARRQMGYSEPYFFYPVSGKLYLAEATVGDAIQATGQALKWKRSQTKAAEATASAVKAGEKYKTPNASNVAKDLAEVEVLIAERQKLIEKGNLAKADAITPKIFEKLGEAQKKISGLPEKSPGKAELTKAIDAAGEHVGLAETKLAGEVALDIKAKQRLEDLAAMKKKYPDLFKELVEMSPNEHLEAAEILKLLEKRNLDKKAIAEEVRRIKTSCG